jgi:protein phosphatase
MLDADRLVAQQLARVTDAPGAATVALCAPANLAASKWLIAWVGDCRVYRLAQGRAPHMELLTRDDTFRHLNEAPPRGGLADDPARMVGNGAITGANTALHGLACGDLLMLCSDGVHKHSGADEWCRVLTRPLPLYQQCDAVLALARFNGSTDDATVMLVRRRTVSHARWFALDRSGSRGATR